MCGRNFAAASIITDMNNLITIDQFNKLTGQETLHPLVGIADLSHNHLLHSVRKPCNFYALLLGENELCLINPGESFCIPSAADKSEDGYTGVLFHPDLLCDTALENDIEAYHCNSHKSLCDKERATVKDCINCIANELDHSIDRYSSMIIVSQIGLLLNYCTRFCN